MQTIEQLTADAIAELLKMRESAANDLAVMPAAKEGSDWARDRYADVAYCNRQLTRLGYKQAPVLTAEMV